MNAITHPDHLRSQSHASSVLRFITCGSVDDGKSTLIGRLLYDTKTILSDQLDALSRAKGKRTATALDLSLLTDGLEAEREQGITIDVAYRYFATAQRKFIVADCPGHEQYTRNMVTGASTADVAVVLIDAAKLKLENGAVELLPQTRRHTVLAGMLGLRHVVFAVNKLDLYEFDQTLSAAIEQAARTLAKGFAFEQVHVVPLSALEGDNVVESSARTPWYQGPTLLELLETLPLAPRDNTQPLRFAVQGALRARGSAKDALRGYMGRISSGQLQVGATLTVLPTKQQVVVKRIHTADGDLSVANAGQSVTVVLEQEVDISRGNWLVGSTSDGVVPELTKSAQADLAWLGSEALALNRRYLVRHGTQLLNAKVTQVQDRLNLQTLVRDSGGQGLDTNAIGRVSIEFASPVALAPYSQDRALGAFVLIDEVTHETVAAGMVQAG